jgi:hypothetical protein
VNWAKVAISIARKKARKKEVKVMKSAGFINLTKLNARDVVTLALGLRPKQGGCKVPGQKGDPGITSHAPGSAKSVRVHYTPK